MRKLSVLYSGVKGLDVFCIIIIMLVIQHMTMLLAQIVMREWNTQQRIPMRIDMIRKLFDVVLQCMCERQLFESYFAYLRVIRFLCFMAP